MNAHKHTERPGGVRRARLLRRGTSIIEFVLVLPFLGIIVGLTFFFGWTMMHKHQVLVADRYSAWQRVQTGSSPTEDVLNEKVFNKKASSVSLGWHAATAVTAQDLVDEAAAYGPRTEELAEKLLQDRFPVGPRADVSASFDAGQALWQRFSGPIRHQHGREGVAWRRDDVNCWVPLRDLYYADLDNGLRSIPDPAEKMAGMIRRLYLARW
jgi:Flp pilus assembly protein TadG